MRVCLTMHLNNVKMPFCQTYVTANGKLVLSKNLSHNQFSNRQITLKVMMAYEIPFNDWLLVGCRGVSFKKVNSEVASVTDAAPEVKERHYWCDGQRRFILPSELSG